MASCAQRWTIATLQSPAAPSSSVSPPFLGMRWRSIIWNSVIIYVYRKTFIEEILQASALRVVRWSAAAATAAAAFGYHNFYDGKTIRASRSPVAVAEWSISWRIAQWNPFRRQTVVDCHNKESLRDWETQLPDSWRWQIFVLSGCMWPKGGRSLARRGLCVLTRSLETSDAQLQLENCTFYGCHKRATTTTTTTTLRDSHFHFSITTSSSLWFSARFETLQILCFLPLVIVFGASQKPNSNPKPFSQLLCAVGVWQRSSTSTAGGRACLRQVVPFPSPAARFKKQKVKFCK